MEIKLVTVTFLFLMQIAIYWEDIWGESWDFINMDYYEAT